MEIPNRYAETMDCFDRPREWDVPGMIADIADNVRVGNDVPDGQLLAALDWMAFRLRECNRELARFKANPEVTRKLRGF